MRKRPSKRYKLNLIQSTIIALRLISEGHTFEYIMRHNYVVLNGLVASIMCGLSYHNSMILLLYAYFKDNDSFDLDICKKEVMKAKKEILKRGVQSVEDQELYDLAKSLDV